MEYVIENEQIRAVVESKGCELVSVIMKADNTERIWQANPECWKRHAPVLFPLVGKYKDNRVTYEGNVYEMSQHGFARDMEFTLAEQSGDSIVMTLTQTEDTLKKYPFAFELRCSYVLKHNKICVGWKVINTDNKEMYFSIGAHPAFVYPGKNSLSGCTVRFKAEADMDTQMDSLEYELLNEQGLVKNEKFTMKLIDSQIAVSEDFFDKDAYIFENGQCGSVALCNEGKPFVMVNFDAPVFGLWSTVGKNVPFICIEPWYGRADREDFEGTLDCREWGNALAAGEVFEKEYEIVFLA